MAAHQFSFYSAGLEPSDGTVSLSGDEHFHLTRVLRMSAGDAIRVTNGRGLVVCAEIESIEARHTTARVSGVEANSPEPVPLVLALGLLPRAHMDAALAQCIEAGITGFVPVMAERCHARQAEGRDGRWTRVAIAAMKQCGRAWLPRLEPALDPASLIATFPLFARVVLADADAMDAITFEAAPAPTLAIVGPEAGFTDDERRRLIDGGAHAVRLSAQRLRAETAALALASMLAIPRGPV
jgi:16S rRNA (uracil1498-N3)-methyltransferase